MYLDLSTKRAMARLAAIEEQGGAISPWLVVYVALGLTVLGALAITVFCS